MEIKLKWWTVLCSAILILFLSYHFGYLHQLYNADITKISWIMDKTILLTLKDKMLEINKSKNWNYDVTDMFPFQYSVYHENDHYDWHVDTGSAYLKQKERKISFSLILNDNYKGGELEFKNSDENISLDLNKGDMVTFPSFLEHRVKPVLNGTRISLVGWMLGPC